MGHFESPDFEVFEGLNCFYFKVFTAILRSEV